MLYTLRVYVYETKTMNIFYLNRDPYKAAEIQYNKHVVKMILESAQMLCTAHHHYAELYDYKTFVRLLQGLSLNKIYSYSFIFTYTYTQVCIA